MKSLGGSVTALRRPPMLVVAALVLAVISCARQGMPPGGPEDTTPPVLQSSTPEAGAVGVSRTSPIVLEFSEPMEEKTVEDNLFIVPIPDEWPRLEWHKNGRVLVIRPVKPLPDNATHVITIGAKALDRHKKSLSTSLVLSFSTGDKLERKRITGRVIPLDYTAEKPLAVTAIDVIAYRLGAGAPDPDPRTEVPDYVTQTGDGGEYELFGLSQGKYRLFAIGDRDQNGFYTENEDHLGIASADMTLTDADSLALAPDIALAQRFFGPLQLTSIRATDARRVELTFDRPVVSSSLHIGIEGLAVEKWYADETNPRSLTLVTAPQEAQRAYPITMLSINDNDGNTLADLPVTDRPTFAGTDRADTTALSVTRVENALLVRSDEALKLLFNRPLALPENALLIGAPGTSEGLSLALTGPRELTVTSANQWIPGGNYTILLDTERIRGIAGNMLTINGAQVPFRMVPADTLTSLSGVVKSAEGVGPFRIVLRELTSGRVTTKTLDAAGAWDSGSLLPGRYLIAAHRDRDADGVVDQGMLAPYGPAEQLILLPDTLTVESHRPTAGIDIEFR